MNRKIFIVMIMLIFCFSGSLFAEGIKSISLIALIANPEACHDEFIRIIGYVEIKFEGNAIYLSAEDMKIPLYKNGLWIVADDKLKEIYKKNGEGFYLIEGIFNADRKGHMSLWSGSIEEITRFMPWGKNPRIKN